MKMINHHLICPFQRRRCYAFLISSLVKRKSGAKDVCRIDEPHSLPLLIAISKGRAAQRKIMRGTKPIGVLLLIAQGWQTIVQATLG